VTSIAIITGAMAVYHCLMSSTLQGVVTSAGLTSIFCCGDGNYQYMAASIIIGLCMVPLLSIRDIGKLAKVGGFGVIAVLYNVLFLVLMAVFDLIDIPKDVPTTSVKMLGTLSEVGGFVGMMGLSLFVQSVLLPIAGAHTCARTAPQKVTRDLGFAYFFAVLFYVIVGAVPAVAFELGHDVLPHYIDLKIHTLPQNMLLAFGAHSWGALVGRLLLVLQIGVVYPILGAVMRKQFFGGLFNREWPGWTLATAFNLTVIGFTTLTAAVFPNPATVVGYVGAYTAIVYILWLPILVHLKALRRTGQSGLCKQWWHMLFATLGSFAVLMQFLPRASNDT